MEEQQWKVQEQSGAGAELRDGVGEKEHELMVEEKQKEKCHWGNIGALMQGTEVAEA